LSPPPPAQSETVGQIAKIKGCRAVGIAGGAAKCRYIVDELGFDAAIDHKSEDLRKTLRTHRPTGVNVYFDKCRRLHTRHCPHAIGPACPRRRMRCQSPNTTTRR
jgi:NADPH:quinone reductase-like Zn-dependent oxidoreductase